MLRSATHSMHAGMPQFFLPPAQLLFGAAKHDRLRDEPALRRRQIAWSLEILTRAK